MLEKFFDFSQSFLFFNIIFYPKNLIFWAKFSFLTKISIFEVWSLYLKQKLAFICKRSSFFTNNWTFHQNLHFAQNFDQKFDFSYKFYFHQNFVFCENFYFVPQLPTILTLFWFDMITITNESFFREHEIRWWYFHWNSENFH